jgi:hypothetical protein
MSTPTMHRSTFWFASILVLVLPIISFAQGRGNGKGNGGGPDLDKKCAKFVNCHDARDGRWDGRGPAINTSVTNPTATQFPPSTNGDVFRSRRHRDRERDNEIPNTRSKYRRSAGDWVRNSDGNNSWRRRRTTSNGTETRHRHVHRSEQPNVD